jgi:hypothetical protein
MKQRISDHPNLKWNNEPIRRYIEGFDNLDFTNKATQGWMAADVPIQHFGFDGKEEIYIPNLAPDLNTTLRADNKNNVAVTGMDANGMPLISRTTDGTGTPEYDTWVSFLPLLPQGVTLPMLISAQVLQADAKGDLNNY